MPVRVRVATAAVAALLGLLAPGLARAADADLRVEALASRYARLAARHEPAMAYLMGAPIEDHATLGDRSPAERDAFARAEDTALAELRRIDPAALSPAWRAAYAVMQGRMEADGQMRVCRVELWDVNHFTGWPQAFVVMAGAQPVGDAAARAQALARWSSAPAYVDQDIADLNRGLALGYSAPQSVVRRTIALVDRLIAAPPEASPFYGPIRRDGDPAFKAAFQPIVTGQLLPALKRYRDFLEHDYLPRARQTLAVSDLPHGAACYQAFLRANTTLNRTPRQVFELGSATVEENRRAVIEIGRRRFGLSDFDAIVARVRNRPEGHFASKAELLAYSQDLLARAKARSAALVTRMPVQDVVVLPEREFEEAAAISSHYEPSSDPAKPATYRIQLGNWATQTRGDAAIAVVHEAWPGHHLQIALAREIAPPTPVSRLGFNAAYVEGWARVAEGLGETAAIYPDDDAAILRRLWPARGLVVDPGLHALGWSRAQAVAYITASGRFTPAEAEDLVDRIAAQPGQLTAYDTGALEFAALRSEAEARLGPAFDLAQFHMAVLEEGIVPLGELRGHVEAWLRRRTAR
ncbi:MAG: DUF885 domain-containing protein [Caulobacterales bacterium]|nr:DUF885 domain-containing protein [Caulobacterales bacterium]